MTGPLLTRLNAPDLARYTAAGYWGTETLYAVAARHAQGTPDAFAVRDRHRRLNYRELVAAADRLAAHLAGHGVRPGERVAVWLPSRVETAVALLACSRNSYLCCPSLHRGHTVGEVAALVDRMRAAALIAQPGHGADADRRDIFAALADRDCLRLAWSAGPADSPPFADLSGPAITLPPSRDANRIMYLPFTSGTSGMPKGVLHSDNTLLATARMMARDWHLEGAVLYTLSPLSHNLGLGALVTALAGGGELVVHDLPRGTSLIDRLEETGAAFLFGVPTHAIDLLAELRTRGLRRLAAVRGFRISGAAAPAAVAAALMDYGVVPQSGYGMTETCSHQYTLPDDPPDRIVATSGRACAGYEIRIWHQDDPDSEAAPGEIGEIGGRGASLMLGYFDDQIATEAAFNATGWFMTGDLGRLDADGYLQRHRPQEGRHHSRRPQHPSGADRGPGPALPGDRAGGSVSGARPAARRARLPRGGDAGWRVVRSGGHSPAFRPRGPGAARHAGIHPVIARTAADRQRQDPQARAGALGGRGPRASDRGAGGIRVMRAIVVTEFGPPEALRVGAAAAAVPGPGEVLVEIHAVPVNYVDMLVVGGTYQFLPAFPFIPGKGPSGVVTALGPGVTGLSIGDRVLAMAETGGYAEAVAIAAEQCHRLPSRMSYLEAASLAVVYDTSWVALRRRARLVAGETVLVLGASGGVGHAAVQLARAMGARVLAGVSRAERAALARASGADAIIDLSRPDLRDSLRDQVYAETEGRGADIIIDPLGGQVFEAAIRALAWCGRLVVIGFAAGGIPSLRTNYLLLKNIEVSGLQITDYRKRCPAELATAYCEIFGFYELGLVTPAAATSFPLDEAGAALAAVRDRRIAGRAVLRPRED